MFPIYDQKTYTGRKAYVTWGLIFLNVVVFLITYYNTNFDDLVYSYGVIPDDIVVGSGFSGLLTAMFLHADFWHLTGNIWFLWIFGDNVEAALGRFKFLIFYLITGLIASLAYIFYVSNFSSGDMLYPMIGASGAISGVLGAYLILFPKNEIKSIVPLFLIPLFFSVKAYVFIAIYFIAQVIYFSLALDSSVAYMAHAGGFLAGIILIIAYKKAFIRSKTN